MSTHAASTEASWETGDNGVAVLTHDRLDVQAIAASVADDTAGATAVFIGTTRNSFRGKAVTRLDYQAYSSLAVKTMANILRDACNKFTRSDHRTDKQQVSAVIKCTVHHRLGTVRVGEPSIVIAVSSPHRKESFLACEYILEEVKARAQIWKREFYEGEKEEDAEWKSNNGP
ncbi:molybdenum cofactor synthesis 2 [Irpex rosettiformis]|uniref:Molybdenum cofactor synthesis 2 n=1 Tax=Irpex rosettiformis TaxID=378272 RepID=A0ACB8UL26_9APHY|nr:molybdenum cofactor synthesis 2 [Irpex rosettiformis]